MSAYMVDKDHVDFLVQSALAGATDSRRWQSSHERHFSYYSHARNVRVYVAEHDEPHTDTHSETISPSMLGQLLADTNAESINARYPDTVDDPSAMPGPRDHYWEPYVFEPIDTGRQVFSISAGLQIAVQPVANTATVAAQLNHYEYQACEHADWRESDGFAFCEAMRDRLLRRLPGAEQASWGYSRSSEVATA